MTNPTHLPEWRMCQACCESVRPLSLDALAAEMNDFSLSIDGIGLDMTRTHMPPRVRDALLSLARAQEVEAWRERMFAGEKINVTEKRAVLHTALRAPAGAPALLVDGEDVREAVAAVHDKMRSFVAAVRDGLWRGATGQPIKAVVNIGIGGSDLGPRLAVSALRKNTTGPRVLFVANVDAADLSGALEGLDPATTLFLVVSKTFTTQETLLNARSARAWLVAALGEAAVSRHFVAVSTNEEAVRAFGIDTSNMFAMWDWVGGRYSLWSAVGLSIALAIGWDGFLQLLAGAAAMDRHFQTAPLERNMPVLFALAGLWYRNFWKTPAEAVLPYSERLRDLPRYLQQLNMESNGKSVTRGGGPVDYETGPIVFGECGSVGQHSFHQWLHQGPTPVLAEFIVVREDDLNRPAHHAVLLAHARAQMEALKSGRREADPARTNPGNRPSLCVTLERLDPYHLGLLLALYEHKVFVQGSIWDINSFDQFGVELGKKLAESALKA